MSKQFDDALNDCLERIAAGDEVRDVWKFHDICRIFRFIGDRKNVTSILMRRFHARISCKIGFHFLVR